SKWAFLNAKGIFTRLNNVLDRGVLCTKRMSVTLLVFLVSHFAFISGKMSRTNLESCFACL
ncbi:MAG: hypothetical protein V3V31_12090, partial [Methylococcales bacterium]